MWTKFKHSLSVSKRTQRKYEAVVLLHVDQDYSTKNVKKSGNLQESALVVQSPIY